MRGTVKGEFTEFSFRLRDRGEGIRVTTVSHEVSCLERPGLQNKAEWSLNLDLILFAKWVNHPYLTSFLVVLI